MTRKELAIKVSSSESESLDKNEILQKYIELNDACDQILERINKGNKKHSKSNRSK
jgi:hypothetical protein